MSGESCMTLGTVVPEMMLAGLALALVPVAGFARDRWRIAPSIATLAGLALTCAVTAVLLWNASTTGFCGAWAMDRFASFYKLLLELGAFITVLALVSHFRRHAQLAHAPVLVLFATVGGMGLVSSRDLALIVLFLQMLSLPSYLLVVLVRGDRAAQEAALKYFLYAAAALAVMAYGLSFLFGLTGSLELPAIGRALRGSDQAWIAIGLGLVLVGYAFEATLVPFHFATGAVAPS